MGKGGIVFRAVKLNPDVTSLLHHDTFEKINGLLERCKTRDLIFVQV